MKIAIASSGLGHISRGIVAWAMGDGGQMTEDGGQMTEACQAGRMDGRQRVGPMSGIQQEKRRGQS